MEYRIRQLESVDYESLKCRNTVDYENTFQYFFDKTIAYTGGAASLYDVGYSMELSWYTDEFGKHRNDTAFAAICDDKMVGLAWARADFGFDGNLEGRKMKTPEIKIAVRAEYQGMNIGTNLLIKLLYSLGKQNFSEAEIFVAKNDPSLIFFLKLGFSIISEEDGQYPKYHLIYNGYMLTDKASSADTE
ncbi:MAG: GNAT family N-acetyltransferase [Oscillospiraceae bacterium]|nr:GNAT family N-acetyltransferase [Oscillospiraceae bacterium]